MDKTPSDEIRAIDPHVAPPLTAPQAERPSASSRQAYRAPRLVAYGRVRALTLGPASPDISDRALKEGFAPVDPRQVLARVAALPIETWSYKGDAARHLGPMAQDFAAAFGLGADDRHIFPLDAGGVALAAIQGLHALVQAQEARIAALERELRRLRGEIRVRKRVGVA